MTALEAIVSRVESLGLATGGVTLFAGTEADLPVGNSPIVTLIETGGHQPIASHNDGLVSLHRPSFQVSVRGEDYATVSMLIRFLFSALTFSNTLVGSVFFLLSSPDQSPFSMPNDANGRVRMTFNFSTIHR